MRLSYRIFAFLLILGIALPVVAAESDKSESYALGKAAIQSTGAFDGNRINTDLENNGMIVSHRISGHSGMEWPKGNHTYAIYASGLWMAGKVGGEVRTAVAEYEPEFTAGPFGSEGDEPEYRLYKVNKVDLNNPAGNPDFAAWPVEDGAPWVDNDGDGVYTPMPGGVDHPRFLGDQVIFFVMNDGIDTDHSVFSTDPLGLEIQTTIWGYDRNDAFGDMMFVRSRIFNKGGNDITETYLGLWSDPDLGNASDDFVGCDTTLSLGITYNDGADDQYGTAAPAIGYDFFQAAFPSHDPADTTFAFDVDKPGYVNLQMSSFVKYINADDVYTDPNDADEAYFYMKGFKRDGTPFINSATGQPAKFVHPDDPNDNVDATDNVWVDVDDNPSDDRRFLMNVGPFDFAAGDSAEVVYGIILSQGADALSSVTKLKEDDILAQKAYDVRFALPDAPPQPQVTATAAAGSIVLEWGDGAEDYKAWDNFTETYYNFEGYNVYQFENAIGTGTVKKIATFDLVNDITTIEDVRYVEAYGANVLVPVQNGTDSGLKHTLSITTDAVNGGVPLVDDRTYYFAVTAYGYGEVTEPHLMESAFAIFEARSQTSVYVDPVASIGDDFEVTHTSTGLISDGNVTVTVINPSEVTGDDYEVYFETKDLVYDGDTSSVVTWNVKNTTTGAVVLEDQTVQSGLDLLSLREMGSESSLTFDGLQVVVNGPSAGFHGCFIVKAGDVDRSVTHDDVRASVFMEHVWTYGWYLDDYWPLITFPSDDPVIPNGRYWVTQGGGDAASMESYVARVLRNNNADYAIPYDFEFRWLGDGDSSYAVWFGIATPVGAVKVPFEIWNIGIGTPDDATDDFQMIPRIYDFDGSGTYNWHGDLEDSGALNDAGTDWVYWWEPTEGMSYADFETAAIANDATGMSAARGHEVLARTIFMNHNGVGGYNDTIPNAQLDGTGPATWTAADTAKFLAAGWIIEGADVNVNHVVDSVDVGAVGFILPFPTPGSVYRWITNKPNAEVDKFTFSTAGYGAGSMAYDPANVKVWPNPYFGYNPEERTPLANEINFINLPETATINIYTLAGQLVNTIDHSGGQEATWNAQNSFGVLVASGVYIAVVSSDEGEEAVLKLAVVMPAQRLDVY